MSAMAEHDCIATHQPTMAFAAVVMDDDVWVRRWRCPDYNHTWEWIPDADSAGGAWYELAWPQYTITGPGSFTL
jgi:hypothetical protein